MEQPSGVLGAGAKPLHCKAPFMNETEDMTLLLLYLLPYADGSKTNHHSVP